MVGTILFITEEKSESRELFVIPHMTSTWSCACMQHGFPGKCTDHAACHNLSRLAELTIDGTPLDFDTCVLLAYSL